MAGIKVVRRVGSVGVGWHCKYMVGTGGYKSFFQYGLFLSGVFGGVGGMFCRDNYGNCSVVKMVKRA